LARARRCFRLAPAQGVTIAKTGFKSIDDYIAAQPAAAQEVLSRVRTILLEAIPGAEGAISYQTPALKPHGRAVIYFAGWKNHSRSTR